MAVQWLKAVWPPYSLDLNPLEYLRGIKQARVNTTTHQNKDTLRHTIQQKWDWLSKAMILNNCSMIRPRLEKVVAAGWLYR
jgi:hypothetical protein